MSHAPSRVFGSEHCATLLSLSGVYNKTPPIRSTFSILSPEAALRWKAAVSPTPAVLPHPLKDFYG